MAQPLTAGPVHRPFRFGVLRLSIRIIVRLLFRVRLEGAERLPDGPAMYCSNHLNWTDPLVLLSVLPATPKLAMFGPREADMTKGGRNRLIVWAGFGIPYRPEKTELLETTRRVQGVLADGWVIVIFGEGRIHRGERELLPLAEGTAFFALRAGVPIVPIAINGTSWLRFGARVRIRIGEPIVGEGRPDRTAVESMTATLAARLEALLADAPTPVRTGRSAAWMTERFNEWPEGSREAALAAQLTGPEVDAA